MRLVLVLVVAVFGCSIAGLPPSQLPTETGKVVDSGTIVTRKGTERFAVTERKGGGFILHTRFETLDMAVELDTTWHPIGGTIGSARLELVDGKLVFRRSDARVISQATGPTDFFIDPMSIAQFTPLCSLAGDTLVELPDKSHTVHRNAETGGLQTVSLSDTNNENLEVTCNGPKLLVFVGGHSVAYRSGYRDLAMVQSGGLPVP
jgi:hypothetical protein